MKTVLSDRMSYACVVVLVIWAKACHAEPSPAGTWDVVGRDQSGTKWSATLFLEPMDKDEYPPTRLKGFFDWDGSNKTGGREYVVLATYDYDPSDPSPVFVPVLMRELGNSPRGVSEGGA
jgi:hypothetical protein